LAGLNLRDGASVAELVADFIFARFTIAIIFRRELRRISSTAARRSLPKLHDLLS
jgi:hypothetical protein